MALGNLLDILFGKKLSPTGKNRGKILISDNYSKRMPTGLTNQF